VFPLLSTFEPGSGTRAFPFTTFTTTVKTLTSLFLNGTKVTDAGVKELQKALPKCRIYPPPFR
jgi:hypothetical protein